MGGEMTYREAVRYIEEIPRFAKEKNADMARTFLRELGHPERSMPHIHVAGTNGKGSTCAFLSAVYRAGGIRTGLFTSPHLIDMRERFRVDGDMVTEEAFLSAFRAVYRLAEEKQRQGAPHPTYFEFLFLMAMVIFRDEGVELSIVETGIGGRLDATNVIEEPLCCVITTIGMDHMQQLGPTIASIAAEKAGIIKPGVPVVFDDGDREAVRVIRERAEETKSPMHPLSEAGIRAVLPSPGGIDFLTSIEYDEGDSVHLPIAAPYQAKNAGLVLLVWKVLRDRFPVPYETVKGALSGAVWEGRMQCLSPKIYVDGAHNENGVAAFCEAARLLAQQERITLIFGAMADKEVATMVRIISEELAPKMVIATEPDATRRVPADELVSLFSENGIRAVAKPDPKEALTYALSERGEGWLFCAGSLYLIGRILSDYDQLRRGN